MPRINALPTDTALDDADRVVVYDAATDTAKTLSGTILKGTFAPRSTHTGTQTASTISDLTEAVQDIVGAEIVAGAGMTATYNDTAGTVTLTSTGGAGGSQAIAQTSHGLAVGNAVRYNGSAYVKAKADDPQTAYVQGVVTVVTDVNNFTLTTSGAVTGLSGLTTGRQYYLSDTSAGDLTLTRPYANASVVVPVLTATASTTGIVDIQRGQVNVVSRAYAFGGINFGYSTLSSTDTIIAGLQYIGRYTNKIRLSIPSWNDTTGITNMRALVLIAKNMGFETTYGVTAAGTGHNAAYVDSWLAQVSTEAAWADANGVDIFYIGNEEDWWATVGGITGYTADQIQDFVLAKAATLKGLYPNLTLVYSTAEGHMATWDTKAGANANWAYLDGFGLNMYNTDFTGTMDYALSLAYADKLFLSEWNDDANYPDGGKTAAAYRAEILARRQKIEASGVKAYFFTFDWGGSYGSTDDWGLSNGDGTFKPGIEELFSIPR